MKTTKKVLNQFLTLFHQDSSFDKNVVKIMKFLPKCIFILHGKLTKFFVILSSNTLFLVISLSDILFCRKSSHWNTHSCESLSNFSGLFSSWVASPNHLILFWCLYISLITPHYISQWMALIKYPLLDVTLYIRWVNKLCWKCWYNCRYKVLV